MALNKSVMRGGALYQGFELIVGTTAGAHVLDMAQTSACVINAISIVPDDYGPGDTMDLAHWDAATTSSLNILATNIYNLGAGVPINFDLPALEDFHPQEPLRLTYNKVDEATPVTVHVTVEYGGLKRKS